MTPVGKKNLDPQWKIIWKSRGKKYPISREAKTIIRVYSFSSLTRLTRVMAYSVIYIWLFRSGLIISKVVYWIRFLRWTLLDKVVSATELAGEISMLINDGFMVDWSKANVGLLPSLIRLYILKINFLIQINHKWIRTTFNQLCI